MSAATVVGTSRQVLSGESLSELADAKTRAKKIRKAARVAACNGWITGLFAAVSLPFALFSIDGFLVCASLILVAYNEFRGRKRLLRFDASAATLLGWNQVGFLGLIILYSLWMIYSGLTGASPIVTEIQNKPELAEVLGSANEWDAMYRLAVVGLYGTFIVLSAIFQGLTALYYFTRRGHIEAYVRQTPPWVIQVQCAS